MKVHSLDLDQSIPDEWKQKQGIRLFQQGGKLFKFKNTPLYQVISRAELKKELESKYKENHVYLDNSKLLECELSVDDLQWVMAYFKKINDIHKSEAAVLLLLNTEQKKYTILPIVQSAVGMSVSYAHPTIELKDADNADIKQLASNNEALLKQEQVRKEYEKLYAEGFKVAGTIHSHCDAAAFHSSTDDADEMDFEGLHITIGKVNSGFDFSCRFIFEKTPFKVDIEDLIDGTVDDLTKDLDEIEIEQCDLDLLFHKKVQAVSKIKTNPNRQNWGWRDSQYDSYPNFGPSAWQKSDDQEEIAEEFSKKVLDLAESVLLYSPKTQRILCVSLEFYYDNEAFFSEEFYQALPDPTPRENEEPLMFDVDNDYEN